MGLGALCQADAMPDSAPDTVLLTYAEIAAARRISVASATRLVRRRRWRRVTGNDGAVRVHVPTEWATKGTDSEDTPPGLADAIRVLEAAVTLAQSQHAALADQLTGAGAERDRLADALSAALRRAETAEAEAARLRSLAERPGALARALADRLADALAAALRRAGTAEAEAAQLRAVRDRPGVVARVLARLGARSRG
jgi:hypothetical protein